MPFYDYKCPKCEDKLPVSHPMTDAPTIICAKCQSIRIKIPAISGVSFKGGGWGSSSS